MTQSFQELTGTVWSDGRLLNVTGSLCGAQIALEIGRQLKLNGLVDGKRMTVTLIDRGGESKYSGIRTN